MTCAFAVAAYGSASGPGATTGAPCSAFGCRARWANGRRKVAHGKGPKRIRAWQEDAKNGVRRAFGAKLIEPKHKGRNTEVTN